MPSLYSKSLTLVFGVLKWKAHDAQPDATPQSVFSKKLPGMNFFLKAGFFTSVSKSLLNFYVAFQAKYATLLSSWLWLGPME